MRKVELDICQACNGQGAFQIHDPECGKDEVICDVCKGAGEIPPPSPVPADIEEFVNWRF